MNTLHGATIQTLALAALALATLAPRPAAAQATLPPWRELVIYAADPNYPAALARRGVQGETLVELRVGADGSRSASVRDSSRSAELDALALEMARRLDLRSPAAAASGLVKIQFRKDSKASIATKSCADFNADAAYYMATFEEGSARAMPVMVESIGRLIYGLHREHAGTGKVFPPFDPVLDATVATCARTPEAGFADVMRQEALKRIE